MIFFILQIVVTLAINYFGKPGNKGLTHISACWGCTGGLGAR
jgi:hypothetical protein